MRLTRGQQIRPDLFYETVKGKNIFTSDHRIFGNWLLIFMQSVVTGEEYGEVTRQERERIKSLLREYPDHQVLIFTHHHPVVSGSAWLDKIGIRNRKQLLSELAEFRQIRAMIYGHIHQEKDDQFQHMRLLGTPSTCLQFRPQSSLMEFDATAPAYRYLTLHGDGLMNTGVRYAHHAELQKTA